ncbi:glycosyltransferase [Nocardiopsis dassonvillei]|uniref:glycosyltransferase n=1 Tax=Nocardiopsis dassonvillei TaxID=2014 RepID=UPI0033FD1257
MTEDWEKRSLRILLVNGNYADGTVGGTQTFTQNLAQWLTDAGHKVAVLCHADRGEVEEISGVKVYRIRPPRFRQGGRLRIVAAANQLLAIHNPLVTPKVRRAVRDFDPDICHVQMLRRLTPCALAVIFRLGIPVFWTVHELYSLWNFNPFLLEPPDVKESQKSRIVQICKNIHRRLSKKIDRVLAPSEYALNAYVQDGYFAGVPTTIMPNTAPHEWGDPHVVATSRRANLGQRDVTRFLFMGRLESHKGVEVFMTAAEALADEKIEIAIAGEGTLTHLIRERVALSSHVSFHGSVSGQRRHELFAWADVLVCPSSWTETYALVVAEAQASALPVIVTDVGALPERVDDGHSGLVVPSGDHAALAQAMLSMRPSQTREKMITAAAERALSNTPMNFTDRHIEAYRDALRVRAARSRQTTVIS